MKIIKQGVLIIILTIGIVLTLAKFGHADSAICNDFIFTETSSVETKLEFPGTIPVKKIKVFGTGARIYLHTDTAENEIYFNEMAVCISINDEVDSAKNLRWFLEHSTHARISNWNINR